MAETRGPLEVIYDEEISPLMREIIAISRRHDLPMFCTFALDGDLACTSINTPPVQEVPEDNRAHYATWYREVQRCLVGIRPAQWFAYTVTSRTPTERPTP